MRLEESSDNLILVQKGSRQSSCLQMTNKTRVNVVLMWEDERDPFLADNNLNVLILDPTKSFLKHLNDMNHASGG